MTHFKAILFDWDDTLVNSFPARVAAAKVAARGVLDPGLDLQRIMREWAGRPQMDIWRDLTGNEQKAKEMLEDYRKWYWKEEAKFVRLFPGVREMLDQLKAKGFGLGVVTSKARLMPSEDGPYGAVIEMGRLGLDGTFDSVVGWEDAQKSKPAPEPILIMPEKLRLDPREVLMVGDSHIDVTTARRAGAPSAGAMWGTLARDLVIKAGPDFIVESPSQLCTLLS
ncbi:MAG: HAD family hydrolase [Dehalococcoidia bacterium]